MHAHGQVMIRGTIEVIFQGGDEGPPLSLQFQVLLSHWQRKKPRRMQGMMSVWNLSLQQAQTSLSFSWPHGKVANNQLSHSVVNVLDDHKGEPQKAQMRRSVSDCCVLCLSEHSGGICIIVR